MAFRLVTRLGAMPLVRANFAGSKLIWMLFPMVVDVGACSKSVCVVVALVVVLKPSKKLTVVEKVMGVVDDRVVKGTLSVATMGSRVMASAAAELSAANALRPQPESSALDDATTVPVKDAGRTVVVDACNVASKETRVKSATEPVFVKMRLSVWAEAGLVSPSRLYSVRTRVVVALQEDATLEAL
jgi:hypothetical protein